MAPRLALSTPDWPRHAKLILAAWNGPTNLDCQPGLSLAPQSGPGILYWLWHLELALEPLNWPQHIGLALAPRTGPGTPDWPWRPGLALAPQTDPGTPHWPWHPGLAPQGFRSAGSKHYANLK